MVKDISKKVLGFILILLGVISLVVPLVPGIFLMIAGLYFLGGKDFLKQFFHKEAQSDMIKDDEIKK